MKLIPNKIPSILTVVIGLVAVNVSAQTSVEIPVEASPTLIQNVDVTNKDELIRDKLKNLIPSDQIVSIEESVVADIYLVDSARGSTFVFVKDDHVMVGDLFSAAGGKSMLDAHKDQRIVKAVESIPYESLIDMGPKDAPRHITVFTDIDCGYCRKLQNEAVPVLQKAGVDVRYIMWPRSGVGTKSYEKAVSAFCADDPVKALETAKAGQEIPKAVCDNPVADLFNLGRAAGVNGTPNIITDDGKLIKGYLPADRLLALLGIEPKS